MMQVRRRVNETRMSDPVTSYCCCLQTHSVARRRMMMQDPDRMNLQTESVIKGMTKTRMRLMVEVRRMMMSEDHC